MRPWPPAQTAVDCKKAWNHGPLNVAPFQLKYKKSTLKSGQPENACANSALMMALAGSTLLPDQPKPHAGPELVAGGCAKFDSPGSAVETCMALTMAPLQA